MLGAPPYRIIHADIDGTIFGVQASDFWDAKYVINPIRKALYGAIYSRIF